MHKITLYTKRKLHLPGLVAWERRLKRCRHVCKSQNVCPTPYTLHPRGCGVKWKSSTQKQKLFTVQVPKCPNRFTFKTRKLCGIFPDIFRSQDIFAECVFRPIQSISCDVRYNVCQSVYLSIHMWKLWFPVEWRFMEWITNIGMPPDFFFSFSDSIICCFLKKIWVFWSLRTSLLCIVEELAGVGSVAVAVGVSDSWQVTCDTQHMSHDTWHATHDTWHATHDTWHATHDMCHVTGDMWHLTRDTW